MVPRRGSLPPITDWPTSYSMRTPVGSSKMVARSREQSSPSCVPSGVTFTVWAPATCQPNAHASAIPARIIPFIDAPLVFVAWIGFIEHPRERFPLGFLGLVRQLFELGRGFLGDCGRRHAQSGAARHCIDLALARALEVIHEVERFRDGFTAGEQ